MDASSRKRLLVFAGLLAVLILALGVSAVTSSGYRSVCQLAELREPQKVVVGGNLEPLHTGSFVLRVGNAVFGVSDYGFSYAVVSRVSGSFGVMDTDDSYAVFLIKGKECGDTILALYSAREFTSKYGTKAVFEEEVVVEGYYNPNIHAEIIDLKSGRLVYSGPVLIVSKILKGCHEAYGQGAANVG